ncbi:MAG: rod-binding protein [Pseudomonadota bacterium]
MTIFAAPLMAQHRADPSVALTAPSVETAKDSSALREVAVAFEAAYLAEMLAHAGLGAPRKLNGGGAGETAFASMLAREWAEKIAATGGVGIADRIVASIEGSATGDV